VRLEHLPRIGETVSGGEYYTSFGGKGANQAVAALKAGAEVTFVAKVGRDETAMPWYATSKASGLSAERIVRMRKLHRVLRSSWSTRTAGT